MKAANILELTKQRVTTYLNGGDTLPVIVAVGSLKIEVNGVPTSALYVYRVTVSNSDDIPLKDMVGQEYP